MTQCKTAVTPLITHWSYCSLTLSHLYVLALLNARTPTERAITKSGTHIQLAKWDFCIFWSNFPFLLVGMYRNLGHVTGVSNIWCHLLFVFNFICLEYILVANKSKCIFDSRAGHNQWHKLWKTPILTWEIIQKLTDEPVANKRVSQMRAARREPAGTRTDRQRCYMFLNIKRNIS